MSTYQALTAYGVPIPKAFAGREDALQWAADSGHHYPGCRIVMRTKTGLRTVWRQQPENRSIAA